MKNIFTLSKINFGIAVIVCFIFPLHQKIIPLLTFIWAITFIFEKKDNLFFYRIYKSKFSLLLLLFFALHVLCLLYTDNLKSGFFDIESKLSLLLFPIILPNSNYLYKEKFNVLLKAFILGGIVTSLICLGRAMYLYIELNAPFQYFTYTDLSLFLHPTYYSMYLCFGIVVIFHLLKNDKTNLLFTKIIYVFIILLFYVMIFLLSSKAGLISISIITIISLMIYLRKTIWTYIFIIVSFLSLTFVVLKNDRFSTLKTVIIELFRSGEIKKDSAESNNERIEIWKTAITMIHQNWFLGVGAGDVKYDLAENYNSNFNIGVDKQLNAHNQYLETFLGIGIIGFITFLVILFYPFYISVKYKNVLLLNFIIIITINSLFESIINTQAGIMFFALFYCLISINNNQENDPKLTSN